MSGPLPSKRRRPEDRLAYPLPAATGTYCTSVFVPDESCTTKLAISPSMRVTPDPTTFRRTVPSVICELTVDAVSDPLSTTSVLGLSYCVTIPEKVPPSVHDAPDAELSAPADSGPSLIWNAFN